MKNIIFLLLSIILLSCKNNNGPGNNFNVIITKSDSLNGIRYTFSIAPSADSIEMVLYYVGTGIENAPYVTEQYSLIYGKGKKGIIFYPKRPGYKSYENGIAKIITKDSVFCIPFNYVVEFN